MRDRGILTERDREIIPNEPNNSRRPEVKTRIRNRIDNLEDDLAIIEEHEPELAAEIRETICAGSERETIYDILNDIQDEVKELRQLHTE